MKAEIHSLWKEERGVSEVLGALLMLLIVVAMWGTIQAYHVPNWNKDVEYEHLNMVHDDMMTFKSDVEDVALSGEPKSSNIHMGVRYPNRMFLANPGPGVAGSLTSESVPISIVYTIDSPGNPTITQSYNSNRIVYEEQGTVDSPKLVYEHGVIIRDYANGYATTDKQPLIVGDNIYIPVLLGNLTASSSMETESIALKPLSLSDPITGISWVQITMQTSYPKIWKELLAGTSTAAWPVEVDIGANHITITGTAITIENGDIKKISFAEGNVTTDALYAGMIKLSTTSASESAFIIGGGTGTTGTNKLSKTATNYVAMFNAGVNDVESAVIQFISVAGTVSSFRVNMDGSPGGGQYSFVVRKNGVNTLLTCTVSGTETTGSDLSHSVLFAVGDYISIMVTPASNPTSAAMGWTALFSPSQ